MTCNLNNQIKLKQISTQSREPDYKEILMKAGLNAAVSGVATKLVFGGNPGTVNYMGMQIPTAVLSSLSGAVSSVSTDLAHDYVLPYIPKNKKFESLEALGLGLGTSALTNTLFLSQSGNVNKLYTSALGAGSYAASDWIYHRILNKDEGGLF
jgi:hypothetical protein